MTITAILFNRVTLAAAGASLFAYPWIFQAGALFEKVSAALASLPGVVQ